LVSTDVFVQFDKTLYHQILLKVIENVRKDKKQTKFSTVFICNQLTKILPTLTTF